MSVLADVVVARYKENLSWLSAYNGLIRSLTIYDKSGDSPVGTRHGEGGVLIVSRENVGREAETFAYHIRNIVEAGDTDGYIIFLQGSPHEHCPYLERRVLGVPDYEHCDAPIPLGEMIVCDGEGVPHYIAPIAQCYLRILGESGEARRTFSGCRMKFYFVAGAQYVVPKSLLSTLEARYPGIWDRVCELSRSEQGPWVMERLWWEIFTNA